MAASPKGLQVKKKVVLATTCKSFTVEDTTLAYNASSNYTGYGSPNMPTGSINSATIGITKWGGSTTYSKSVYPTFPTSTANTLVTFSNTDMSLASTDVIPDGVYKIDYTLSASLVCQAADSVLNTFSVSTDITGAFPAGFQFTVTGSNAGTYIVTSSVYTAPNTVITVTTAVPNTTGVSGGVVWTWVASSYEVFFCNGQSCLNNILKQIEVEDCPDCINAKVDLAAKVNIFKLTAQYAASCGKANKATVILNYLSELCNLEDCKGCGD